MLSVLLFAIVPSVYICECLRLEDCFKRLLKSFLFCYQCSQLHLQQLVCVCVCVCVSVRGLCFPKERVKARISFAIYQDEC